MMNSLNTFTQVLDRGGPALWAIAVLSVLTLTLILWKLWQLLRLGTWKRAGAETALRFWGQGQTTLAMSHISFDPAPRSRVAQAAMQARLSIPEEDARDEAARQARAVLTETRLGLRMLDLVVTIAPLIGLLGTVLGMIDAFQALQDSGQQADPAALAGGIWEALLTTAAGMAVAIPASVMLSVFDGMADRLAHDLEDIVTRVFTTPWAYAGEEEDTPETA
ncbi:MotA/TolQ/ExbB proton channel family protein [Mameliella alba]|uniref:MotA/TolQ/ExbB proton channel family protein n=1 Tax=Mameliella alba TaxID=561184 RepID=UPI0021BD181D|nr:MotA/TolQ/ExbB proton channel family protein [Mameliella alba]